MRSAIYWMLVLMVVVCGLSCEKPEYTSDGIKLLPENQATAISLTTIAGANTLLHQDLMDIGLQLGRLPRPLGQPSDIRIESSPSGAANAVSVGFGNKRVNLVRKQGKGWRVLNISEIVGSP